MLLVDNVASNGERIFKIGPVVFEPIQNKQTNKQTNKHTNIQTNKQTKFSSLLY